MNNYKVLNKDALLENLQRFKSKQVCAMVKSNAYGHGLREIVGLLKSEVDFFGVVNIDEAIAVRKKCENPILICSKVFDYAKCKKYDIDVEVDNEQDLLIAIKNKNNIHLKINSGMNRFGARSELALKQLNKILENNDVGLKYIHTHFRNLANKRETEEDYKRFLKLKSYVTQKPLICFGGSDVIDYDFDYQMVRCGIGLYGYSKETRPVEKIVSYVLKIFYAKAGEGIGYNSKYIAKNGGLFAIVPLGYGDGLRRCLSGKFVVKINNVKYNAVGNICMDAFFVRVDQNVKVGDQVVVMENANDLSKDTIVYEVLTGFSNFRGKTIIE